MVGVNIAAAETDAEAQWLATTRMMTFTDLVRGKLGPTRPPIDDMDAYWSPTEKLHVQRMLARSIVGSKSAVKAELKEFLVETGAGEVIIAFDIYDHKARLRSQELAAQCMTEL
jgi:alkanesulfonate monooxygenase SsuD/methylene tetrahydromethanopterin reductase-like flavin-dependent oxidoreductase (luciferase family)